MSPAAAPTFQMDPQGFRALPVAYALARSGPVVVLKGRAGREWFVDFEDEANTRVVVGEDGTALLGLNVSVDELVAHYRAGHRTRPDGLGVGDDCRICQAGQLIVGLFTHPQWTAPPPPDAADEDQR